MAAPPKGELCLTGLTKRFGEVRAIDAESIWVPPSDSSPVVLRFFAAEGSHVEPGDLLVRIDRRDDDRRRIELVPAGGDWATRIDGLAVGVGPGGPVGVGAGD